MQRPAQGPRSQQIEVMEPSSTYLAVSACSNTMLGPLSDHSSNEPRLRLERFLRIRHAQAVAPVAATPCPSLTISTEAGIDEREITASLVSYLDAHDESRAAPGWVSVDDDLIDTLVERLGNGSRGSSSLPLGSQLSELAGASTIVPIFGTSPQDDPFAYHPASAAIRRLCQMGNAIVVGLGGHLASGGLNNVFRLRLIATPEERVRQFGQRNGIDDLQEASNSVEQIDSSRRRYVERHFNSDIDDPLAYDLTLNLSDLSIEVTVHLIADSLLEWSAAGQR